MDFLVSLVGYLAVSTLLAIALFILVGKVIGKYIPPLFNRPSLKAQRAAQQWQRDLHRRQQEEKQQLVGTEGVSHTQLRPCGKMRTDDGRTLDVVADGGIVEEGVRVHVTAVNGPTVTVAKLIDE